MTVSQTSDADAVRSGFFYALSAYSLWGIMPFYFKALAHIPPVELVAHRVIWAVPVALMALAISGRLKSVGSLFLNRQNLLMMSATAALISINWGVFVWAISVNIASEVALGYYINPLISVLLGFALLGERLTKVQLLAVAIAAFAVLVRAVLGGDFPWASLILAFSFAGYGYLRKTVQIGPRQGFLMEVVLLSPIALGYVFWLLWQGENHFNLENSSAFWNSNAFWLMLAGPVTAVPLILFASGTKLLPLKTIGLMQYIVPTMIFLISFLAFGEELGFWQGVTFGLIWIALALYSWSIFKKTPEALEQPDLPRP